jgi:hypothetical protein
MLETVRLATLLYGADDVGVEDVCDAHLITVLIDL